MTYRSKAYIEGTEAFGKKLSPVCNPYSGDTWQKLDWDDGFYDASRAAELPAPAKETNAINAVDIDDDSTYHHYIIW